MTSRIHWSGCWEQRDDRRICRWMIAWIDAGESISGCVGGYSGGGAFQLEKFSTYKDGFLTTDSCDFADLIKASAIADAEDCQDLVLNFHVHELWEDYENLVLRDGAVKRLMKTDDLLFGGEPLPDSFDPIFEQVGLISRYKRNKPRVFYKF